MVEGRHRVQRSRIPTEPRKHLLADGSVDAFEHLPHTVMVPWGTDARIVMLPSMELIHDPCAQLAQLLASLG